MKFQAQVPAQIPTAATRRWDFLDWHWDGQDDSVYSDDAARHRRRAGGARADGLDGWLLYDFHGSNPIARALAGLERRRQDDDAPLVLPDPARRDRRARSCTPSSRTRSTRCPATRHLYAGREALAQGLDHLLEGVRRVAMEYSPENAIPYLARVDAGTVESFAQPRRRGRLVRRSRPAVRRAAGTPTRSRRT